MSFKKWTKILPFFILEQLIKDDAPDRTHFISFKWGFDHNCDDYDYVKENSIEVNAYRIYPNTWVLKRAKSEYEKKREELTKEIEDLDKVINKLSQGGTL